MNTTRISDERARFFDQNLIIRSDSEILMKIGGVCISGLLLPAVVPIGPDCQKGKLRARRAVLTKQDDVRAVQTARRARTSRPSALPPHRACDIVGVSVLKDSMPAA